MPCLWETARGRVVAQWSVHAEHLGPSRCQGTDRTAVPNPGTRREKVMSTNMLRALQRLRADVRRRRVQYSNYAFASRTGRRIRVRRVVRRYAEGSLRRTRESRE